ncbi:MAG: hypothetical protein MJE12_12310 [Alphaproteobacteria bacterium]|nr:hypothetical protein [Alphaproteobacteria bacterium]
MTGRYAKTMRKINLIALFQQFIGKHLTQGSFRFVKVEKAAGGLPEAIFTAATARPQDFIRLSIIGNRPMRR